MKTDLELSVGTTVCSSARARLLIRTTCCFSYSGRDLRLSLSTCGLGNAGGYLEVPARGATDSDSAWIHEVMIDVGVGNEGLTRAVT